MRYIISLFVAVVALTLLLPASARADSLTVGFINQTTNGEEMIVRGTAPRGQTVALSVNGDLQVRVIAGPSMDVYKAALKLNPGPNRITVALEGTDLTVTRNIFRLSASFKDLDEHWARSDIEMLATLGVINGIGDGAFGPELQLTRAQFAKLMVLGLGLKVEPAGPLAFTDNADLPDWSRGYVAAAVANGLIKGYADGTFKPAAPVSRVEMAVIAARGLRLLGVKADGEPAAFADGDAVPAWAQADVELSGRAGVVGAYFGKEFHPSRPGTRAEAAALVRRLWSRSQ